METKDAQRLAVVEEQIKNLANAITALSTDLRSWQQNYVPREEIKEMFRSRDQDIQELRAEIREAASKDDIADIKAALDEMKNDKRSNRGLYAAWAGVLVSGLAVIVAVIAVLAK